MRPLMENKNLSVKLALQKDLPEVELDRDKIVQVLTNFLQNAIKFTLQGEIMIESSLQSQEVKVSVKDTGIGIAQNKIELRSSTINTIALKPSKVWSHSSHLVHLFIFFSRQFKRSGTGIMAYCL